VLTRNRSTSQPRQDQPNNGLHFALNHLGVSLAGKLTDAFASRSTSRLPRGFEDLLREMLPKLLEQEFTHDLLAGQPLAQRRRAVLMHVLSSSNLQAIDGQALLDQQPSPIASPEDDEEITSEEAAKLLRVSRTHLNTLMDRGLLAGSRTAGGHRRVSKASLEAYKSEARKKQLHGLRQMVSASNEMGLYGTPAKRKSRA